MNNTVQEPIHEEVNVFIEIGKNSNIKYEYDHKINALVCDRVLHTPFKYPFNYGFIPNTLSLDSDPLDVVVLMDDELVPGCQINCKIIGCLETKDDAGNDPKIITCPSNKVDPTYNSINEISDVPAHMIEKIKYFFLHYKDLENKHVQLGNTLNKQEAISIYKDAIELYNREK